MRVKLRYYFTPFAIRHVLDIPRIISQVENWFPFLLNFSGLKDFPATYNLKNGIKFKTTQGSDSPAINAVFLQKIYGKTRENSTIIDIGGNIGVFSIYSALTSKNSTVYAYEPSPKNYKMFKENCKLNNINDNIKVFNSAVSGKSGKREFFIKKDGVLCSMFQDWADWHTTNTEKITVDSTALKEIFDKNKIEKCDILKLDCEGSEYEILFNLPKEYFGKIKEIHLEYHDIKDKRFTPESLISLLQKNNFKITQHIRYTKKFGILSAKHN